MKQSTKKPRKKEVIAFLRESNAIEGVYDDQSLLDSWKAWQYIVKQKQLTLRNMQRTHRILMQHQPLEEHQIGHFRTIPVYVGGKEAVKPSLVKPFLLMRFCFETARAFPPPDALALHIVYEKIHPFVDGNGRTGRMFMNWTRVSNGEPLIVFRERDKDMYYKLFK